MMMIDLMVVEGSMRTDRHRIKGKGFGRVDVLLDSDLMSKLGKTGRGDSRDDGV